MNSNLGFLAGKIGFIEVKIFDWILIDELDYLLVVEECLESRKGKERREENCLLIDELDKKVCAAAAQ